MRACASQVLQQRVEQLRIANWQRVTSPTWMRDSLLNVPTDGSADLKGLAETVTITPYNSSNVLSVNTFSRAGSSATAAGGNTSLLSENAVIVKWSLNWSGIPAGRTHKREVLAVLGKGGVAK